MATFEEVQSTSLDLDTANFASSDVWASVIANAAPLKAVVGEKNAREFLRVASSKQLWLFAAAPLGILSLLVSSTRLAGPRFLKRLVGRGSDRKIESQVELTALSVEPANSVYTSQAVEVESSYQPDRAAFVSAYVRNIPSVSQQLASRSQSSTRLDQVRHVWCAFKETLAENDQREACERDCELVLALHTSSLSLFETVQLAHALQIAGTNIRKNASDSIGCASFGHQTTGISPTQSGQRGTATIQSRVSSATLFLTASVLAAGMVAVQVGRYVYSSREGQGSNFQTLIMGLVSYCCMGASSIMLLFFIQGKVSVQPQFKSDIFKQPAAKGLIYRYNKKPSHSRQGDEYISTLSNKYLPSMHKSLTKCSTYLRTLLLA
ncbi:MAG: hypothetical protein M1828_004490 [Chrysothrix sp. TS-e1954]|nr:MAG: hypothetical protein M1828_004490 [Chrysothrix sp. TS-e1954]